MKANTNELHDMLYYLYKYYNKKLFKDKLSKECVITFVRKKGSDGYLSPNCYKDKKNHQKPLLHEIALNPDHFDRDDVRCHAILFRIMIDLYLYVLGKLPQRGYCSVLCANIMEELGLVPRGPGGKRIGQKVFYDISPNGKFMKAYNELVNKDIKYVSPFILKDRNLEKNKTKYACKCKRQLWGAPEFDIICGSCWVYYLQENGKLNDDLSKKNTICVINSAVEFEKILKGGVRFPVILIENKEEGIVVN